MSENKELIWVPSDLAKKFVKCDSQEKQKEMVEELIRKKRLDISSELEQLDDDMLIFKGACLKHKLELEKVYNKQNEELEKLWENMGDISAVITKHVNKITEHVKPLDNQVASLSRKIDTLCSKASSLDTNISYKLVSLAEMLSKMDDTTITVLKKLLDVKDIVDVKK